MVINYLKTLSYSLISLFISIFLITTLNYLGVISNNLLKILGIIFPIIISFIEGVIIGKKSNKKGYLEGLKISLILVFILFILNLLLFGVLPDLKNIIYGDNSIIEKIGQILYRNYNDRSLNELFNQSIIMAYRLLFISYFETKYESQLFYEHDNYKIKALFTLYKNLEKHFSGAKVNPKLNAYKELCDLFNILDEGSVPC